MFWRFGKTMWGKTQLPGPKEVPRLVGSLMVVEEKQDPDWVWSLRGVVQPTEKKKAFYCRIFNDTQATQAGVKVKDWNSLDNHPALIRWEGDFDAETNTVRREKFLKPSGSSSASLPD